MELERLLAQKNYNESVVKKAEARLKQIKKITKNYSDDEIEKIYTSMNKERQALVTPVESTWDQLLKMWYEEEYQGKEFKEGTLLILTEKGERVRSKSEKILADYFYRNNIPYKYEKPLYLKGYGIVYPDFTLLSKKTYQEIYWENACIFKTVFEILFGGYATPTKCVAFWRLTLTLNSYDYFM